jgi:hypothetical protein
MIDQTSKIRKDLLPYQEDLADHHLLIHTYEKVSRPRAWYKGQE